MLFLGPIGTIVPFATEDASVPRSERSYFVLMASTSQHWERALTLLRGLKHATKSGSSWCVFFGWLVLLLLLGTIPRCSKILYFLVDLLVDTCRVRLCKPPKIWGLTIANKRHTTAWKRWLVAVFHGRKNSITQQEALGTWRDKQCFVDFLGWAWPKKYPVNYLGYFRMVCGPLMSIHFEKHVEHEKMQKMQKMQSPHKWWGKASTNN